MCTYGLYTESTEYIFSNTMNLTPVTVTGGQTVTAKKSTKSMILHQKVQNDIQIKSPLFIL